MLIHIIAVGKVKEKYLEPGIDDFRKRLGRFAEVKITEISALPDSVQAEKALLKEAEQLLSKASPKSFKVALCPAGKILSSEEVAAALPVWFERGQAEITIFIGSSRGLHADVLASANAIWSFGTLTLTHGVARFIAVEQLYRAFKINANESYHK